MTFPQTPLATWAEIQLGSTWTDITSDVRGTDGLSAIAITRGITSSGGSVADRGTCELTLTNDEGKYSARNPRSPYFGQLRRNTPLRAGVLASWCWLGVPYDTAVTATTPDATALHITGDLDVRVDSELANWTDANEVPLAGRWDGALNCSWAVTIVDGSVQLTWTTGGSSATQRWAYTDLPTVAAGWGRMAIRAVLDVDNGASGHTVTFYSAPTIAGPWTAFATASDASTPGTTSVYAGTRPLEIGTVTGQWGNGQPPTTYRIYGAQLLNSSSTVVASPDFTTLAAGATSWTDSAGRTWTAPTGGVTNRLERFTGEVAAWPPTWDTGGFDVTASITANGILQRLQQGQQPLASAMRRQTLADTTLRAYWPMEDAAGSTQGASALPSGAPLRLTGVTWASDSTLAGSAPLPVLAGAAQMTGPVPVGAAGDWSVGMIINLTTLPAIADQLLTVTCSGGTAAQLQVTVTVTQMTLTAATADGTVLGTASVALSTITTVGWAPLQIYTFTSGGIVGYNLSCADGSTLITGISGSPGVVSAVSASWSADLTGMGIGHLMVGGYTTTPSMEAARGNPGFDVPDRIYRTASDAGIPVSVLGIEVESETVGPEPQDTALAVIQDAAAADEGVLYESREFVGLRYRNLRSLYNQPSALDLPYYATPQPVMAPLGPPTDDDQLLRNTSTVTRTGGSSSTVTQTAGQLTPALVGTYSDTVTLNVDTDDRTLQHAAWRVHLGTWDEARYPSVTIEIAKQPSLMAAVSRIDTGSRIRITGTLPNWLPPGPIDLLVLGYSETISQFSWRITFACVPYGPYRVGVWADPVYCRADTAGSTIAVAATSSATGLVLSTTTGPRWTDSPTYPTDFPFDLMLGGERVTVTALTGVVYDSFTRTTSSSWGSTDTGDAWTVSGGSASDYSVASVGRISCGSVNVSRWALATSAYADVDLVAAVSTSALATGGSQYVALAARAADTNNAYLARLAANTDQTMTVAILKRVGGTETTLGTYTVPNLTHTAAAQFGLRLSVAGSTVRTRAWSWTTTEPQLWHVQATDTSLTAAGQVGVRAILSSANTNPLPVVCTFDSMQQVTPQRATVVRAVNGITKAQTAGTAVALADQTYIAL